MTPTASIRRGRSPPPLCNTTKPNGKGASTSTGEGASPSIKNLLEAWLNDTLVIVLSEQAPCTTTKTTRIHAAPLGDEHDDQPDPPTSDKTHNVIEKVGDNVLIAVLKRMEETKNEK